MIDQAKVAFDAMIEEAKSEALRAIGKYPQPNYVLLKVAEEAGEVVKAAIHFSEGRDNVDHVREEIRQVVAMLYRLWIEGDRINGIPAIGLPWPEIRKRLEE